MNAFNIKGTSSTLRSGPFGRSKSRHDGSIRDIKPIPGPISGYLMPGFIDAHVHVESSMLIPSEFARLAVTHMAGETHHQ